MCVCGNSGIRPCAFALLGGKKCEGSSVQRRYKVYLRCHEEEPFLICLVQIASAGGERAAASHAASFQGTSRSLSAPPSVPYLQGTRHPLPLHHPYITLCPIMASDTLCLPPCPLPTGHQAHGICMHFSDGWAKRAHA